MQVAEPRVGFLQRVLNLHVEAKVIEPVQREQRAKCADGRAQFGNDASASTHCRDDKPPLADGEGFVERWLGVNLQGRASFRTQGFVGVQSAREGDGQ